MTDVCIGLDLGTKCGWAVLAQDDGEYLCSGTWDLSPTQFETSGMRMIRWERAIRDLHERFPTALVRYELVRRHKGPVAGHIYGGFQQSLLRFGESVGGWSISTAEVSEVKRLATGKGNASKAEMVDAALGKWFPKEAHAMDDNEADALWIAESGRRWLRDPVLEGTTP